MKIVVVGAGSIGCVVGAALADVAEVSLIGRPRVIDAAREHGLSVTSYDGSSHHVEPSRLTLATSPDAAADADAVLVAVKSGATESAVGEIAPYLRPDTVVVSLQNGLRNPDRIRGVLPEHTVVPGMVAFNVVETAPARFHRATSGDVMVGSDPRVRPLVDLTRGTWLPYEPRADMREVQHAKLLLNLMNPVVALADRPLKECLSQRDFRRVLAACQREALQVFAAHGVRPARLGPLPARATARVLTAPDGVFTRVAAAQLKVDPEARSSMWDDLQHGRPTEIGELQGAVVDLGWRRGIPTPVCSALVDLVREAEQAGADRRRWSAADLRRAVGA
ncbi:2-dehydropantoate 2-reductase [Luteipulveratus halotolerans]|uniref:2-dehydropantoate 2-reductase n=1 Tax=Luteipulveratus halotolerans TaxID=1631356 RepID=A0A0L6CG54_9MICO|nr:2-dehydropantoate 2-reductase [Luteipulveratus halotolerans]KNX36694.1 hypothetical protein VV01_05240 [Luteipulveratus halotolerans]